MQNPRDLVASLTTGHLYVGDWGGQCVWRVEIERTLTAVDATTTPEQVDVIQTGVDDESGGETTKVRHTATKWLADIGRPHSLSVTKDGNVVVCDGSIGVVTTYSAQGDPLLRIPLKEYGLDWPRHAIQTSKDSFLVCHGDSRTTLNRVCEIDSGGKVHAECGGSRGRGPGRLSSPFHLASEEEDAFKFLVDEDRVLVLRHSKVNPPAAVQEGCLIEHGQCEDQVTPVGQGYLKSALVPTTSKGHNTSESHSTLTVERVLLRRPPGSEHYVIPRRLCYVRETGSLLVVWQEGCIDIYFIHV